MFNPHANPSFLEFITTQPYAASRAIAGSIHLGLLAIVGLRGFQADQLHLRWLGACDCGASMKIHGNLKRIS